MESNYFLILQLLPGNYAVVDIRMLDIFNNQAYVYGSLDGIDLFTINYSIEEIKASIQRSNVVKSEYLNGPLRIIDTNGQNLSVLTKEKWTVINEVINNIDKINITFRQKIQGYYSSQIAKIHNDNNISYDFLIPLFNSAIKEGNIEEIYKLINALPYQNRRKIWLSIYKEKIRELDRSRILELNAA